MNKEEFLAELREYLSGRMSPADIESNVDYYRAYIEGEIMKGRSEAEVLEELGPARLIAKTLTSSLKDENTHAYNGPHHSSGQGGQSGGHSSQSSYDGESSSGEPYDENAPENQKGYKVRKVASVIIIAVVIMLLLFLFGGLFRGILRLVLRFLPIIIIIAVISWISRGARGGRG